MLPSLRRRWQAAATLLRHRRECAAVSAAARSSHSSSSSDAQRPLRLFVCAGDEPADRAAAALVAALKQQHKAGVQLLGLVRSFLLLLCALLLQQQHVGGIE